MEKYINNTEEIAQSEPLSGRDKLKIALIAIAGICIVSFVVFGIIIFTRAARIKDVGELLAKTAQSQNAAFSGQIKTKSSSTEIKGVLYRNDSDARVSCDIDYGNRAVLLQLLTRDNDAYFYIESEQDYYNLHADISGINAFLGKNFESTDWKNVLKNASTEEIKLSDTINADKMSDAVRDFKSRLNSPFALFSLAECSKKDNTYTIETDMYKLMTFAVKSTKELFAAKNGYANLKKEIENQKDILKKTTVTVIVQGTDGYAGEVSVLIGGDTQTEITLSFSGVGKQTEPEYEANPEICEDVSLLKAYRTLLRSGLDVGSAQKEASMSLNAFSEFYMHSVVRGTIVIVYDENGNDFRFIYTDKNKLEEIDYEAEEYSAWENGGYVLLDTSNLDSGHYQVKIYEPGGVKNESNDYNNAYLSALNACYIVSKSYAIPEGAIFLVKEDGTDFQFSYSGGNLYDVYEQYYYIIYTDQYGTANLSDVEGMPQNVTMYIPNETSSDK